MIEHLDAEIRLAEAIGSRTLNVLRRDRTIFMVMLLTGIGVDETVNLKLDSFRERKDAPALGNFALLTVATKRQRKRVLQLHNPMLLPLMDDYLSDVRPKFLTHASQHSNLLFLSPHGSAISPDYVRRMLLNWTSIDTMSNTFDEFEQRKGAAAPFPICSANAQSFLAHAMQEPLGETSVSPG